MGTDRRSRRGATQGEIRVGWRMGGMGMEVASQVGAGALLGWLWDRWRGTAPTGLLVGAVIGIVVGLWSLIRGGLKLNRDLDRESARRRSASTDDNERADG
ncbi:MAG: AtpZ/AtpI family protein [Planctomycetota bacterium]